MNGVVSGHNKMLHVWNWIVLEMQVRNKILYISSDWGKEDGTIDSLRGHNKRHHTVLLHQEDPLFCPTPQRANTNLEKLQEFLKNGKWPLAGDK